MIQVAEREIESARAIPVAGDVIGICSLLFGRAPRMSGCCLAEVWRASAARAAGTAGTGPR